MPKVLDLFCGAGGAGMGYHLAGYELIGVDRYASSARRYPFEFHRADAMEIVANKQLLKWESFDLIHASPPCQSYSSRTMHLAYPQPKLIEPLRELLEASSLPYVIENVEGAPMKWDRTIMLCGTMFGRRIWRHRYFESNIPLTTHFLKCNHSQKAVQTHHTNRRGETREFLEEMEVLHRKDERGLTKIWMTQDEARQAVPPYFTEYIGLQIKEQLNQEGGVLKVA